MWITLISEKFIYIPGWDERTPPNNNNNNNNNNNISTNELLNSSRNNLLVTTTSTTATVKRIRVFGGAAPQLSVLVTSPKTVLAFSHGLWPMWTPAANNYNYIKSLLTDTQLPTLTLDERLLNRLIRTFITFKCRLYSYMLSL